VEESIWKKGVRKDAGTKDLGPYRRAKRRVYAKKEEDILTIKRRKRGSTEIHKRPIEERIHPTLQIIPNITSTLCGKKGWYTEDGAGLSTLKLVDDKEWILSIPHCRYIRWSRKEEGVYEIRLEMGIQ